MNSLTNYVEYTKEVISTIENPYDISGDEMCALQICKNNITSHYYMNVILQ